MIPADDERVARLAAAVDGGDVDALTELVHDHPELATERFGDAAMSRCCLHVATDWPGRRPNVAAVIAVLVAAGADVGARFAGPHRETALHWAASSDDVAALDALVDAGADLEADGGVLTDGPPLDDAVVFGQWAAARRLVARGASTRLFHAAALGLVERTRELLAQAPPPDERSSALWHACRATQLATAALLLDAGADPLWPGYDGQRPLDVAEASGSPELVALLHGRTDA